MRLPPAFVKYATRALAVAFFVVAYVFLLSAPHPPTALLGVAYAASGGCLAVASWRLMFRTMD